MNQRVKEVRKYFKMTQKEFAKALGVTQSAVSWIEGGGHAVTDQTIKSICTHFNVSENWLRTGIGEMIIEPDTFSLDKFVADNGGTELELEIIKTYFELDPEIRGKIFEHFKKKFSPSVKNVYDKAPDTPEELERSYPPIDEDESNCG